MPHSKQGFEVFLYTSVKKICNICFTIEYIGSRASLINYDANFKLLHCVTFFAIWICLRQIDTTLHDEMFHPHMQYEVCKEAKIASQIRNCLGEL
jgi:hypothetical protein